ncbi:MAG: hypothetical protein PWQ82_1642 [Thermosediminibacterales bacterium]|nr:hypothetical protein [Thermosediminibacterales bacterium]MDK2836103.1 hypothetical protein [Thermosediminibacterales bacterium]
MKLKLKKFFACILLITMVLFPITAFGETKHKKLGSTIDYVQDNFQKWDKVNLDWLSVGLFAAGEDLASQKWSLLVSRNDEIRDKLLKAARKTTDIERIILGLLAEGKNPRDYKGRDLIRLLKDTQLPNGKFADSISGKGDYLVNSHIWGIIALHASGENIPNRAEALNWLLNHQNDDGGFSIDTTIDESDVDITGMTLIAFSALGLNKNYPAVKKALKFLKEQQLDTGGFGSWGLDNAEAIAQVVEGLISIGVDPADTEWVKNGENPIDALLSYQKPDGSFSHLKDESADIMAIQQSLIALSDYYKGESVYERLRKMNIKFVDLPESHWAYQSVKSLVKAGVISGYPDGSFKPEKKVTRAEFAKLLIYSLNLNKEIGSRTNKFSDLSYSHWANPVVKLAVDRGLFQGVSKDLFKPEEYISGAQVMTVLVRALGKEDEALAHKGKKWYTGYVKTAETLGLLYSGFKPEDSATRAQVSYSIYKMKQQKEIK